MKSEMVEWLKNHLATTPKEVILEKWEAIEKEGYGRDISELELRAIEERLNSALEKESKETLTYWLIKQNMKNNQDIETNLKLAKQAIEIKIKAHRDLQAKFLEENDNDTVERFRILNIGYEECLAVINMVLQGEG